MIDFIFQHKRIVLQFIPHVSGSEYAIHIPSNLIDASHRLGGAVLLGAGRKVQGGGLLTSGKALVLNATLVRHPRENQGGGDDGLAGAAATVRAGTASKVRVGAAAMVRAGAATVVLHGSMVCGLDGEAASGDGR
jgi:hypothetical protein